jgi:hypothetical protein
MRAAAKFHEVLGNDFEGFYPTVIFEDLVEMGAPHSGPVQMPAKGSASGWMLDLPPVFLTACLSSSLPESRVQDEEDDREPTPTDQDNSSGVDMNDTNRMMSPSPLIYEGGTGWQKIIL